VTVAVPAAFSMVLRLPGPLLVQVIFDMWPRGSAKPETTTLDTLALA
jgi:hypothetical protein